MIARFDEKRHNILKTHHLGNSVYMLFTRNKKDQYELTYRSDSSYKDFEDEPDYLIKQKDMQTRSYVEQGGVDMEHQVRDKDIIVSYTDGVSDNMYVDGILKCLNEYMRSKQLIIEVEESAYCILLQAYTNSIDGKFESPYWKHKKGEDPDFLGGRKDDMTVAVGMIETHHPRQDVQQEI